MKIFRWRWISVTNWSQMANEMTGWLGHYLLSAFVLLRFIFVNLYSHRIEKIFIWLLGITALLLQTCFQRKIYNLNINMWTCDGFSTKILAFNVRIKWNHLFRKSCRRFIRERASKASRTICVFRTMSIAFGMAGPKIKKQLFISWNCCVNNATALF